MNVKEHAKSKVLVSGQTAIVGKGNDLLKNPDVGRLFLGG